jgi:hypothetical protein
MTRPHKKLLVKKIIFVFKLCVDIFLWTISILYLLDYLGIVDVCNFPRQNFGRVLLIFFITAGLSVVTIQDYFAIRKLRREINEPDEP